MKSLRELYRIGTGPSSSHTMGPRRAAQIFLSRNRSARKIEVTLYGSLAATGRGHLTDVAIVDTIKPATDVEIIWKPEIFLPFHPNGMKFQAFDASGNVTDEWTVYSVGGGELAEEGVPRSGSDDVYKMSSLTEILHWCEDTGKTYWEYVEECEGPEIWEYLAKVWQTMAAAVERGLDQEGVLPGPLNLRRRANSYHVRASGYKSNLQSRGLVFSYALAVSEENASGGEIVTAPTCGSCGVVPAVLYHLKKSRDFSDARIYRALATAGLIGNIAKTNASIAGAEVGCQGGVGGPGPLGLACDPVCGLVQIPCIERNAYAAARALDANLYSSFTDGNHRVSYDRVVEVMKETGHDLPSIYKETGEGGLARRWEASRQ